MCRVIRTIRIPTAAGTLMVWRLNTEPKCNFSFFILIGEEPIGWRCRSRAGQTVAGGYPIQTVEIRTFATTTLRTKKILIRKTELQTDPKWNERIRIVLA